MPVPPLPITEEERDERISIEQYEVHKQFVDGLTSFAVRVNVSPLPALHATLMGGLLPPDKPPRSLPPTPKKKHSLCEMIGAYASTLLMVELRYRPDLQRAIERIEALIIERANEIGGAHYSIFYHATEEELRAAARKSMNASADVILGKTKALPPPPGYTEPTPGQELKALRKRAQLTVQKLSSLVNLTPRTIYRHEKDKAKIRERNFQEYERVFSEVLKSPISIKRSQ